jgi:hypothetical protein
MYAPSVYAHIFNGLFLFIAFYLFFVYFYVIKKIDPHKLIVLILLFSIAIGIHGLSHLGLESIYGYNPIHSFTI